MADWNAMLRATLRSNHGEVPDGPMAGRPLLIMTSTGAKSGQPREAVVTFTRDGDRYVIAASAGGAPTEPQWYHNLVANPEVQVEAKGETFKAKATVVDAAEHDRLWARHVAERPEFADYPEKAGRTIPVVTLERIG